MEATNTPFSHDFLHRASQAGGAPVSPTVLRPGLKRLMSTLLVAAAIALLPMSMNAQASADDGVGVVQGQDGCNECRSADNRPETAETAEHREERSSSEDLSASEAVEGDTADGNVGYKLNTGEVGPRASDFEPYIRVMPHSEYPSGDGG